MRTTFTRAPWSAATCSIPKFSRCTERARPLSSGMPLPLSAVVDASARVAQTSSRLAKRDAIAACIRDADPDDVEIVVAYLAGETRQGRIGVGYATLARLRGGGHAGESTLTVSAVDSALDRIA